MTENRFVRLLHRVTTGDPRRRKFLALLGPARFFGFAERDE
jgi:hypothetical protein